MFPQYFGFTRKPFSNTVEKNFLYFSPSVQDAYEQILHTIRDRQECMLLTGGGGMGKTSLLYRVMDAMGENVHVIFHHYAVLPFKDLLVFLCEELGIESAEKSRDHLLGKISRRLTEQFRAGKATALFIDEAQSLRPETLADLRHLVTLQTENRLLLPMLFSGQDPFEEKLERYPLLTRAIGVRCHLEAFDPGEVGEYIACSLQATGCERAGIFTADAVRLIADISGGVPRKINSVCELALQTAYRQYRKTVTREIISQIGGCLNGIGVDPALLISPETSPVHPRQVSGSPPAKVPAPKKRKIRWDQKFLWVGGWVVLCVSAAIFGKEFAQSQFAVDSLQAILRFPIPQNFSVVHKSLVDKKMSNLIPPAKNPSVTKEEQKTESTSTPRHSESRRAVTRSEKSRGQATTRALQKKNVLATVSHPALAPPKSLEPLPSLKRSAYVPQPWMQPDVSVESALDGLDPDSRALFQAAREGDEERVKKLLRGGLRVNVRDARGETALMYAVRAGETSIAKKLLTAGTFVNLKNRDGTTALIQGALLGHTQAVRTLLRKGAHLDLRDKNGRTALMASAWNGHAESSKLLLVYGSDPNLKSHEGWTPLMYAAFNNHVPVVEVLLWKGANIKLKNLQGEDVFDLTRARKNDETLSFLNNLFSSTVTR